MKKVLLLVAMMLGTAVMVNAQTEPAKAATVKEVKAVKHERKAEKKAGKAEKKAHTAQMENKAAAKK